MDACIKTEKVVKKKYFLVMKFSEREAGMLRNIFDYAGKRKHLYEFSNTDHEEFIRSIQEILETYNLGGK